MANDVDNAVLVRTLEARLRSEAPDVFAGIVLAADGAFEVFSVGSDPRFARIVSEVKLGAAPQATIRIIPDRRHSLVTLERVRDRITTRRDAIAALGVTITEWGADVRTNKVRVGVLGSPTEAAKLLANEFGADLIDVVAGGFFSQQS